MKFQDQKKKKAIDTTFSTKTTFFIIWNQNYENSGKICEKSIKNSKKF